MNSSVCFLGSVDCLVTHFQEEQVGLFALPWSDRKVEVLGALFRLARVLSSVVSDGNCVISVIYRMEKVYLAHKWPFCVS